MDVAIGIGIALYPSGSMVLTPIGTNLISADNGTDLIYVHSGITATISTSFATPGEVNRGLTYTG